MGDRIFSGVNPMELKQAIQQVLEELPEDRLREILDFAQYLAHKRDDDEWRSFGLQQFARAYGPDEPEYTEADIKPDPRPT
jgi:hypothetical protein